MVDVPVPDTSEVLVTSMVATVVSPVVVLMVISPVSTSTASLKVKTMLASIAIAVASSAGLS